MTNLACDNSALNQDEQYSAYNALFMLTGLAISIYALARFAESKNKLNYDNRLARIIAGLLNIVVNQLHTTAGDLELTITDATLITAGPHRTSLEAFVLASKIKGTPPRFFATNQFNAIPGVSSLMHMFKAISVEAHAEKSDKGQTANASTLEKASAALKEKGCVALFPQGNFARLGQEPPRVYNGAAKLAIMNQVPIHVIRLDGFWSLQNSMLPLFVRNHVAYRAFLSGFHLNNVRPTLCRVIDFHLQPENSELSDDEKIEEINAQLYAYYRHTEELSLKQIQSIGTGISDKTHLSVWRNKVKQDELQKELSHLKKEASQPEWALTKSA